MASCNAHTIADAHGDLFLHVDRGAALIAATRKCIKWSAVADGTERAHIEDMIQHLTICTKLFPPSDETADISRAFIHATWCARVAARG